MRNEYSSRGTKQSLSEKLTAIIVLESSKPYKKMDGDLVTECVDFLMELEGKEKLTKEEIESKVQNILFKVNAETVDSVGKKIKARIIVAIAAVIAVLFMLLCITSIASEDDFGLLLRNLGYEFFDLFNDDSVELDGIALYLPDEEKTYYSIDELAQNEGIKILYPSWLPENEKIIKIWYDVTNGTEAYTLQCNNPLHSICVYIGGELAEEIKKTLNEKEIADLTVYYENTGLYFQANFIYKNNVYTINSDTEENLFIIIENLEEIN